MILQGEDDIRDHLNGAASRLDWILNASTGPFVLMMHDTALWARNSSLGPKTDFFNSLSHKATCACLIVYTLKPLV